MANLLFVDMITMSLNVVDVENKSVLKHMSSGVQKVSIRYLIIQVITDNGGLHLQTLHGV